MDSVQFVLVEQLLLVEDLVVVLLEKLKKVACVSVNANLMNFLMLMEIAILVDLIKSFPMDNVFVQLDTVSTVVEFVLLLVLKANSPSKEDVLSVP